MKLVLGEEWSFWYSQRTVSGMLQCPEIDPNLYFPLIILVKLHRKVKFESILEPFLLQSRSVVVFQGSEELFSVEPLAPPSASGSTVGRRGQKTSRNEDNQGSSTSTSRPRPLVSLMDIEEEMVESQYLTLVFLHVYILG